MLLERDLQSYDIMVASLIDKILRNNPQTQSDISFLKSAIKQRDDVIFNYIKTNSSVKIMNGNTRQNRNELYEITEKIKNILKILLKRFPDLHETYHQYLKIVEPIHHDHVNDHQTPYQFDTNLLNMQQNLMKLLKQQQEKRNQAQEKIINLKKGFQLALNQEKDKRKQIQRIMNGIQKGNQDDLKAKNVIIKQLEEQIKSYKEQLQKAEKNNKKRVQNSLRPYPNFSQDVDTIKIQVSPPKNVRNKPPLPYQQHSFLTNQHVSISQQPDNDSNQQILPPYGNFQMNPCNTTKTTPYRRNKSPQNSPRQGQGDELWRFIFVQAITIQNECINKKEQSNLMQTIY